MIVIFDHSNIDREKHAISHRIMENDDIFNVGHLMVG